jgi:hypothetical protein
MKSTITQVSAVALALFFLGGCATPTNTQIDEIRSMAEDAQATANNASRQASSALSTANEALDTARRAESAANNALECCNDNSRKIDRMFEKAMRK